MQAQSSARHRFCRKISNPRLNDLACLGSQTHVGGAVVRSLRRGSFLTKLLEYLRSSEAESARLQCMLDLRARGFIPPEITAFREVTASNLVLEEGLRGRA